jgi:hypothetical protein
MQVESSVAISEGKTLNVVDDTTSKFQEHAARDFQGMDNFTYILLDLCIYIIYKTHIADAAIYRFITPDLKE